MASWIQRLVRRITANPAPSVSTERSVNLQRTPVDPSPIVVSDPRPLRSAQTFRPPRSLPTIRPVAATIPLSRRRTLAPSVTQRRVERDRVRRPSPVDSPGKVATQHGGLAAFPDRQIIEARAEKSIDDTVHDPAALIKEREPAAQTRSSDHIESSRPLPTTVESASASGIDRSPSTALDLTWRVRSQQQAAAPTSSSAGVIARADAKEAALSRVVAGFEHGAIDTDAVTSDQSDSASEPGPGDGQGGSLVTSGVDAPSREHGWPSDSVQSREPPAPPMSAHTIEQGGQGVNRSRREAASASATVPLEHGESTRVDPAIDVGDLPETRSTESPPERVPGVTKAPSASVDRGDSSRVDPALDGGDLLETRSTEGPLEDPPGAAEGHEHHPKRKIGLGESVRTTVVESRGWSGSSIDRTTIARFSTDEENDDDLNDQNVHEVRGPQRADRGGAAASPIPESARAAGSVVRVAPSRPPMGLGTPVVRSPRAPAEDPVAGSTPPTAESTVVTRLPAEGQGGLEVQRQEVDMAPAESMIPSPPGPVDAFSGGMMSETTALGDHDYERLAERLYGRIRHRLQRELLIDRERCGLSGDR